MRENRLSGSEGGGAEANQLFLPPIIHQAATRRKKPSGGEKFWVMTR